MTPDKPLVHILVAGTAIAELGASALKSAEL
jgi:hypothetical protein